MNERVSTCQEEIVHIENQNERLVIINLKIKVWISITSSKAQLHQIAIDRLIPSPRGLLQPIEGFLQPAYICVSISDFEPQR